MDHLRQGRGAVQDHHHGLRGAGIARELFMSLPTVKAHVSHIFVKTGVANRVQIAICVHEAGLV